MWKVKYFVVRRGGGVAETQTCGAVSLLPLLPFAIISNKNWYRKKSFGFGFVQVLGFVTHWWPGLSGLTGFQDLLG